MPCSSKMGVWPLVLPWGPGQTAWVTDLPRWLWLGWGTWGLPDCSLTYTSLRLFILLFSESGRESSYRGLERPHELPEWRHDPTHTSQKSGRRTESQGSERQDVSTSRTPACCTCCNGQGSGVLGSLGRTGDSLFFHWNHSGDHWSIQCGADQQGRRLALIVRIFQLKHYWQSVVITRVCLKFKTWW